LSIRVKKPKVLRSLTKESKNEFSIEDTNYTIDSVTITKEENQIPKKNQSEPILATLRCPSQDPNKRVKYKILEKSTWKNEEGDALSMTNS
jgi:hypothetical protein